MFRFMGAGSTDSSVWQAEGLLPDNVTGFLGHSVGHYSALVAAGSMHLSDAARLLV